MVFMGERRPKQRHDAIAHDLVDRALIAMHGGHHALQHRIEELARLFGIAVGEQFHRALEVRKQHRDLLAFAFQGTAGGQDLLREIGGGVGEGGLLGWRHWTDAAAGAGAGSPVQSSPCPASSRTCGWA